MEVDDRTRILRMVAEGKVSAEEGAELLEAVAPEPRRATAMTASAGPAVARAADASRRALVIQVSEGGQTKVNLFIPLALARMAGKFIPRVAQEHLSEYDIDLRELMEDLKGALVEGPLIQIEDGEDRVYIGVQ